MTRQSQPMPAATGGTGARIAELLLGLLMIVVVSLAVGGLTGCEVDSFMDPSRTGRFEFEPTTIPVLDRIDVIEPQAQVWAKAQPPTPEDLMPRELAYYIYPGDVLTVNIFELQQPMIWTTMTRRVNASGFYRVPVIGDVRAAGLTAQQFENEIVRRLEEHVIRNPQVDVVLEQSGGLRYTVYGYVQNTAQYNLDNPNLRLVAALANAGGVPVTTEWVYVIRQVVLSPEVEPKFMQPEGVSEPPSTKPDATKPSGATVEELIRQLEEKKQPATQPQVSPGMLPASRHVPVPIDEPIDVPIDAPQPPPTPPVDIDQLEPIRMPQPPPVDVEALRPQTQPSGAGPAEGGDAFIYVPERGEWVRVPAHGPMNVPSSGPAGGPAAAAAAVGGPPQILDRIIRIDYQLLSHGDSTQNIVIRPDEQIYIEGPQQGYIYIDGEVARIGVYSLPSMGTLTLSRAITAAGGLGPIAMPYRVDLVRKVGLNMEATIRLDLAAIRQRTEPDVILKPDDHIIIGTSWVATPLAIIRNGFRATYGFGFLLDRNFGNDVFGPPPVDAFGN